MKWPLRPQLPLTRMTSWTWGDGKILEGSGCAMLWAGVGLAHDDAKVDPLGVVDEQAESHCAAMIRNCSRLDQYWLRSSENGRECAARAGASRADWQS